MHAESSSNADLVAHFFRRAFDLVRQHGAFGLIATNTVAQGDTRASGLRWICHHGGEIFSVRRRVKWPGLAAVVVSVLHIGKGTVTDRKQIDGRDVERITAFLFHRGGHDDPVRLKANAGKSFQGSIVVGMGFTFDDTDHEGRCLSARCDAPTRRGRPAESGSYLPVHRWRGSQHQPDACLSPLRHQLPGLSAMPGCVRCTWLGLAGRRRCQPPYRSLAGSHLGVVQRTSSAARGCSRDAFRSTIRDLWRQTGLTCWRSSKSG